MYKQNMTALIDSFIHSFVVILNALLNDDEVYMYFVFLKRFTFSLTDFNY
jgi:hypothetical protein